MLVSRIIIYISIVLVGCLLGANVYTSVVDAPNWGSSIPASLDAAKQYFAVANPGTYFRMFSPAAQVAALLSLIVCWRTGGRVRVLAASALVLVVAGDVMTFAYFYPRNAIMFGYEAYPTDVLKEAWRGWSAMNHVRSAIIFAAVLCELAALSGYERRSAMR